MKLFKNITLVILIIFYVVAGLNHFIHPGGYLKIIPDYIPFPNAVNLVSGACEITFAVMALFSKTRQIAGWLIILMLAAFMPVHITMANEAPLRVGSLWVTPAWAWARILLQPVLMFWAWWSTRVVQ